MLKDFGSLQSESMHSHRDDGNEGIKIFQGIYLSIVILFVLFKFNEWSFTNDKADLYFVFFLIFGFLVFISSLYIYRNKYLRIGLTVMIILIVTSLYLSRGIIGLSYGMLIDEISNNECITHKSIQNREFVIKKYETGSFAHTYQYIGLYEKKFISCIEKKLLISQMADVEKKEGFTYQLREEKGNIIFSTEYNGVRVDNLVLKRQLTDRWKEVEFFDKKLRSLGTLTVTEDSIFLAPIKSIK